MILWFALLSSLCSLVPATTESTELERTEHCGTRCSQGLNCKTKPDYMFPRPCQQPTSGELNTTSSFNNTSLSTVMSCEGRQKCSLHLRIRTQLQLAESIHGVSICTVTTGMMEKCQIISFTRASRQRMSGQEVEVVNDCIDVSPNQQVQVTVKAVPSYCGVSWTETYHTPGCTHKDLRRHVPECITGRLLYEIYPERKELSIHVSDILEDHNYYLRLCRKDFICIGTGPFTMIKKEQPVKSVTFPYSRPLPCLCIEGWSAVMDAPRVQVCPFKDRLEELWFGITFDPVEDSLLWQPACPVAALASLCQKREDGICVDLPHSSQNVSREKIIFSKVDPHPQLCVKFSVASQSWIRCPFDNGRFQAWSVVQTSNQGLEEVKLLSEITARFSVGQCVSAGSPVCQTTDTHTVLVEKHKAVALNLTEELCDSCLQVKRTDMTFAATALYCFKECNASSKLQLPKQANWNVTWVVVAGLCLSGILMVIMVTLVLHVLLTVYQRKKPKGNGAPSSEKQMDHMVSALQVKSVLHGGVLVPDSPQCGNNEKTNLLSK